MNRITRKHVEQACTRHNDRFMLDSGDIGYLQWGDIRGTGIYTPSLWVTVKGGGLATSHLRGRTMRETIANIEHVLKLDTMPDYAVIIRAIHDRGTAQVSALSELNRRGLWLSPEQRKQAGLMP